MDEALVNCGGQGALFEAQCISSLRFKQRFGKARLPDDALKSAAPEGIVEWNRDGNCSPIFLELHNAMTSTLADCGESVVLKNGADFGARKDPESTQLAPQPG
jgi:hypothetical protein